MRRSVRRTSPASTTSGILLIALGAILAAVALPVPNALGAHLSVPALGLILVWSGVLLLVLKAYLYRPRRPRRAPAPTNAWYEQDVHSPGDVGGPTTRGSHQRR